MRLSAIIAWIIVLVLLFPSTRRIVTTPLAWLLGVCGFIALTTRNGSRNNRGY